MYSIVKFDFTKMIKAFEKPAKNGEKVYIRFDVHTPNTHLTVRIFNETAIRGSSAPKKFTELKKLVVESWPTQAASELALDEEN